MEAISQASGTPPPAYKDRKTGLIVFGILEILMGAVCVMFLPLMVLGQVMAARTGGAEMPMQWRMLLPALLVYGLLAAVFITLGVGSIRARRWARALSLIMGWSWLLMGVVGLVVYSFVLPRILSAAPPGGQEMPEGAKVAVMIGAMAFLSVFLIVVPGVLVLFFQSRHVKATCEARDVVVRWTDRCPLPVLGLSMWLFLGGAFVLIMPLAYRGVAPFFGMLIAGVAGSIYYIVLAALFIWLATGTYRLRVASWWIGLVVVLLFALSNVVTFGHVDVSEMYRLMGYPEAQIRQIEQVGVFHGRAMGWWSAVGAVPLLLYLLFVKRFFRGPAVAVAEPPTSA